MKALRIVSRIVTGLYILSLVCLVLAAAVWREMAVVAAYAFFIMGAVGGLMCVIEWRSHSTEGTSPKGGARRRRRIGGDYWGP